MHMDHNPLLFPAQYIIALDVNFVHKQHKIKPNTALWAETPFSSYCLMRFLFGLMVSLFGCCNCCITFLTPGDRGIVVVTGRSAWLASWNIQHIQHNMLLAAESKRWSVHLKEQRNGGIQNEGRKMESVWLLKSQAIFVSIVRLVGIWRKTVVLSFQSANRKWHAVAHVSGKTCWQELQDKLMLLEFLHI